MLAKLELQPKSLIYLYNLLVGDLQLQRDAAPEELTNLLAEANTALESVTGEAAWFTCTREGCNPRPFRLTAGELADAEGVVECDTCGRLCERVAEEDLQHFLPLFK